MNIPLQEFEIITVVAQLITVAIPVISIYLSYTKHKRDMRLEAENRVSAHAESLAEIKALKASVEGMGDQVRELAGQQRKQGERLSAVEAKLDAMEKRINSTT
jgi:uncharacterized protein YoxC